MRIALVGAALVCTACQTYMTVATSSLVPGNEVHMTVTDRGATELASALGPLVSAIDGTVVARDSDGVRLATREIVRTDGESNFWHRLVVVPVDAVATVQLKRISMVRSALMAGGIAAGAAFVAQGGRGKATQPGVSGTTSGTQ